MVLYEDVEYSYCKALCSSLLSIGGYFCFVITYVVLRGQWTSAFATLEGKAAGEDGKKCKGFWPVYFQC